VLLAIKSHSTHSYAAKLELDGLATGHGSTEWIEKWLQRNRFPIVGKLGMDNFYSVMKVRGQHRNPVDYLTDGPFHLEPH
jgi:hypothetical protein